MPWRDGAATGEKRLQIPAAQSGRRGESRERCECRQKIDALHRRGDARAAARSPGSFTISGRESLR
jgi:hypothetical protein